MKKRRKRIGMMNGWGKSGVTRSVVCAKGVRFRKAKANRKFNRKRDNRLLLSLGYESYSDYLQSDHWRAIREAKLGIDPNCEICDMPATQVHHTEYDKATLTGRDATKLVSVCRQCHRNIEFTSAGNKRPLSVTKNITEKLLVKARARKITANQGGVK